MAYDPPEWGGLPESGPPQISLDVIKGGVEMGTLDLSKGDHFTFGRMQGGVTFLIEHPTASRMHAVMQFRKVDGTLHIRDLNSTHGTTVNKQKVNPDGWVELHVGDIIQFGQSARLYVVSGPDELRPPEPDEELEAFREMRAASLERRRKRAEDAKKKKEEEEAAGVSWGMDADAEEEPEEGESEENGDGKKKAELPDYLKSLPEHQRQAYRKNPREGGDLASATTLAEADIHERDMKLFERLRARGQKIENLQIEIDRIMAKESAQGGLTDGQRAAVARNEERITALKDEVEALEDEIRGKNKQRETTAKAGKGKGKKAKDVEEEEEFYDRTKGQSKGSWRMRKRGGAAANSKGLDEGPKEVDTYETLLGKLELAKKELGRVEKDNLEGRSAAAAESNAPLRDDDSLESFMARNAEAKKQEARRAAERREAELHAEIKRLEALIDLVKPALPALQAPAREHPPTAAADPSATAMEVAEPAAPAVPHESATIGEAAAEDAVGIESAKAESVAEAHAPPPPPAVPVRPTTESTNATALPSRDHAEPPSPPISEPTVPVIPSTGPTAQESSPPSPPSSSMMPPTARSVKGPAMPPPGFLSPTGGKRPQEENGGGSGPSSKKSKKGPPTKSKPTRDMGEKEVEDKAGAEEGGGYVGYFARPQGKSKLEELKKKLGY